MKFVGSSQFATLTTVFAFSLSRYSICQRKYFATKALRMQLNEDVNILKFKVYGFTILKSLILQMKKAHCTRKSQKLQMQGNGINPTRHIHTKCNFHFFELMFNVKSNQCQIINIITTI